MTSVAAAGRAVKPCPDPADVPTLSVEEAAAILGISRKLAYELAAIDKLPVLRLGRRLRVPTARLRAMLETDPA